MLSDLFDLRKNKVKETDAKQVGEDISVGNHDDGNYFHLLL